MKPHRIAILTAIAGSLFPQFLLAETTNTDALEEVFVTGYRNSGTLQDFAGSASVVDQATLQLMAATHIQETLVLLPGVNLHRNSGQEYLPAVRSPVLSGAGACGSFLIAEDGIPLRPAGFCNVNELFEANWQQAQRVEVIRGPSSALFGSNALHGVINVITPEPGQVKNGISLEAGSLDFYRAEFSAGNETTAINLNGTNDQGFRDNYGVDEQKISAKLQQQLGDLEILYGLTAVNLNQETAGYIEGTNAYKDEDLAESNPNPEAYRDANAVRAWARIENRVSDIEWQVTPYVRSSEMKFLQHFLPGTPVEENGQDSIGIQSAFFIDNSNSHFTFGIDGEYVDGWLKQYQTSSTQGSDFLVETIPVGLHYDYDVTATQIAPFLHWRQALSEQLNVSLGIRYEWMQYDYENLMLDGRTRDDGTECGFGGCRYSRPADSRDSFTNFSPNIDLSYTLDEQQRVHVSLARGFRAPQAVELYRLQREQEITDLDSEQLDSVEIGYRWNSKRVGFELTGYTMSKDNVIYRNSDFFTIDSGETRHQGIELGLSANLTQTVSLELAATHAKHTYAHEDAESGITKGNYVDGAPRHFGNMSVNWHPEDRWLLSAQWQHMGSYYTDPENDHHYPGHDLLNLRGQFQLTPNVLLATRIINATDKRYADRADYTSFGGDRYFPGSPRAAFFEINVNW